jgi:hypothetical protein
LLLEEGLLGLRKRVSCEVKPESWDEMEDRRIMGLPDEAEWCCNKCAANVRSSGAN